MEVRHCPICNTDRLFIESPIGMVCGICRNGVGMQQVQNPFGNIRIELRLEDVPPTPAPTKDEPPRPLLTAEGKPIMHVSQYNTGPLSAWCIYDSMFTALSRALGEVKGHRVYTEWVSKADRAYHDWHAREYEPANAAKRKEIARDGYKVMLAIAGEYVEIR